MKYLSVAICMLLFSCSNKEVEQKLEEVSNQKQKLEKEYDRQSNFIHLLTGELDQINDAINTITLSDSEEDVLVKIREMDSLLRHQKEEVLTLEQTLQAKSGNEAELRLIKNVVENLKDQLSKKEREIILLKKENGVLIDSLSFISEGNKALNDELEALERYRDELVGSIKALEQEKMDLRGRIQEQAQEITTIKDRLDDSQTKEAEGYFNVAVDIMNQFDKIKGPFRKKKKREFMHLAYKNFRQACLLGHPGAKDRLRFIFLNKKYSKHLKQLKDMTKSEIDSCGVPI